MIIIYFNLKIYFLPLIYNNNYRSTTILIFNYQATIHNKQQHNTTRHNGKL